MRNLHRMGEYTHMAEAEETVIWRVVLTDALYYSFNGHGDYSQDHIVRRISGVFKVLGTAGSTELTGS